MVNFSTTSALSLTAISLLNNNSSNSNISCPLQAVHAFAPHTHTHTHINTHTHPITRSAVRKYNTITNTKLGATVEDVESSSPNNTSTSISGDSNINSNGNPNAMDLVTARADAYSFYPSPNGKSGIMAIKLREEFQLISEQVEDMNVSLEITTPSPEPEPEPEPEPDNDDIIPAEIPKATASGMFGGIGNQAPQTSDQSAKKGKDKNGEDFVGKAVKFPSGRMGTVIAQRPPMAFVLCDFGDYDMEGEDNKEGSINLLGRRTTVAAADGLFGSMIDCYGSPMNAEAGAEKVEGVGRAIFAPIPRVSDIALIDNPLLTGTAMVDALSPIGMGQNMLIVGQNNDEIGVGQRDLVIGAIKTQVKEGKVKCVYALTKESKQERERVIEQLKKAGVLDDIVLVSARDRDDNTDTDDLAQKDLEAIDSAEAITVAATACSIAEALALSEGLNTFVVVDDIDQHKAFWDWTTRVLVDVYGVDAVVKDDAAGGASSEMRGFYSGLIQRAAQFNTKNGGGSMTLALLTNLQGKFGSKNEDDENRVFQKEDFDECSDKVKQRIAIIADKGIPLTAATLRKIQIPLPVASESEQSRLLALQHADDLISMSDGQVWLDETLYAKGQRPAMDPQRSITRVGVGADTKSRADAPAMRGLAGGLRFDFAQANSLEGAGANSGAEKQLLKKQAYLLAMHQEAGDERSLSENCVLLLAASMLVLDDIVEKGGTAGTDLGRDAIQGLIAHVRETAPKAMEEIDETLDLSEEVRSELEGIIKAHSS